MKQRAILLLISVTLCLAGAEALLRILVPEEQKVVYKPDPVFGFRHAPLQRVWLRSEAGEFQTWFTTNSTGNPDAERTLEKRPRIYRIAVIGDSIVQAAQVDRNQTFTSLLEDRLSKWRGQPVEVMNFGTASYGTAQEWLYYKDHVSQYRPDLVVLAFFPANDVRNNSYELEVVQAGRDNIMPFFSRSNDGQLSLVRVDFYQEARLKQVARRDRLATLRVGKAAYKRLRAGFSGKEGSASRQERIALEAFDTGLQAKSEAWRDAWDVTARLLKQFEADVRREGSSFHLVIVPSAWEVDQRSRLRLARQTDLDWTSVNRRAESVARNVGCVFSNLLPAISRKTGETELYFPVDGHFNVEGHKYIAAELFPVLKRRIEEKDHRHVSQ